MCADLWKNKIIDRMLKKYCYLRQ